MTEPLARPLEHHERLFLRELGLHLRDLPRKDRTELAAAAAANLVDRPPTDDRWQLCSQLDPAGYAADLRAEHGLPPERRDWWARWTAKSPRARYLGSLLAVALIVASIIGVVEYRRWVDWQAELPIQGFESLHLVGASPLANLDTRAGFVEQETITALPGRQGEFGLMFTPSADIRITQVSLDLLPGSIIRHLRVDTATPQQYTYRQGVPPPPFPDFHAFRPFLAGPRREGTWVRFRFDFAPCQNQTVGVTALWDSVTVHYRGRGRNRVQTVTMPVVVGIAAAADKDCPARHKS